MIVISRLTIISKKRIAAGLGIQRLQLGISPRFVDSFLAVGWILSRSESLYRTTKVHFY